MPSRRSHLGFFVVLLLAAFASLSLGAVAFADPGGDGETYEAPTDEAVSQEPAPADDSLGYPATAVTGDPSIWTDFGDYAPGDTVTLSGANWQAGESIHVNVDDDQTKTWTYDVDVRATEDGTFQLTFDLPKWFVATYVVTATGDASGTATWGFTDGNIKVYNDPTVGPTVQATFSIGVYNAANTNCSGTPFKDGSGVAIGPTGQQSIGGSFAQGDWIKVVASNLSSGYAVTQYSVDGTTPRTIAATNGAICMQVQAGDWNGNGNVYFRAGFTVVQQTSSLAVSSASGTYAGTTTLSATLTVGGNGVAGKTISFSLNGGASIDAVTNASGIATVTDTSLAGIAAGSYTDGVSASYAGEAAYSASNGSNTLTVDKAPTTTTVTCGAGPFTYDGSAYEPCSASVTGAGGLDESVAVTYEDNTDAGTATASASYGGGDNHNLSGDSETFEIGRATSTVTVTCGAGPFTYDGSAHEPCSASVTGAGGLNESVPVAYSDNTDAGTAGASASYAGDDNHDGDDDSTTFEIGRATATLSLSDLSATYDGSSHGATVTTSPTGLGTVSVTYDLSASQPSEAGDYAVLASLDNPNYTAEPVGGTLSIGRASSTVAVTCDAGPFTYNGSAHTPCSASVTGAGGLDETLTVTYSDNTDAGTAGASASYAGDDNHDGDDDSTTFAIGKADQTITVTLSAPGSETYGQGFTVAATASSGLSVAYTSSGVCSNTGDDFTMTSGTGTCTVRYNQAGSSNYNAAPEVTEDVTAEKASQTITFNDPADMTYLDADLDPGATSDSGLSVTYTTSGNCTIVDGKVHLTGAGLCTVTASQGGDDDYLPAESIVQSFDIARADQSALTVTSPNAGVYSSKHAPAASGGSGTGAVSFTAAGTACEMGSGDDEGKLLITDGAGTCSVTAHKAGDENFNPASSAAHPVTVSKLPTTTTVSVSPNPVQYSDPVTFNATVSRDTYPTGVTGSVEFFIGDTSYGTRTLDGDAASQTVSLMGPVTNNIGHYTVRAVFTPTGTKYSGGTGSTPIEIRRENARPVGQVAYSGQRVFWTPTPTSATATVTLAATLMDVSSSLCPSLGYPDCDPWAGNITKANVTFYTRAPGDTARTPISGAVELPVGLVSPDDPSSGTAARTFQYELKSGDICTSLLVGVTVGGNYTMAAQQGGEVEVSICKATLGSIGGAGGSFSNAGSEGFLKGDASNTSQFHYDVKYNKSGTNPQGKVFLTINTKRRADGTLDNKLHTYQVVSNAISTLSVRSPSASFSSKANITEVVMNADETISVYTVDSGAILQLSMTAPNRVAFTVQKAATKGGGGPLWFSSQWDGTKSVEKTILSGEIWAT